MKDYYTAYEVLVTGGEFNYDTFEVDRFDEDLVNKAFEAFEAFKDFVSDTARGGRRIRIWEAGIYNVKHWGILKRLFYYPATGAVEYCSGQDYIREMATLRDCFDWKVRE